jgi:CheY-like chemotaxis protein
MVEVAGSVPGKDDGLPSVDGRALEGSMRKPILMAVHEHPRELATVQGELLGRYAADYEVIAEASATAALERLEALRRAADAPVVVLLAAHAMTGMTGIEYLQRRTRSIPMRSASCSFPGDPVPCSGRSLKAVSAGQIDRYVTHAQPPPDERFHHLVTELLRDWQEQQHAQPVVVTVDRRALVSRSTRSGTCSSGAACPSTFTTPIRPKDGRCWTASLARKGPSRCSSASTARC